MRKESSSITQLVKIVAGEIVDQRLRPLHNRVMELEALYQISKSKEPTWTPLKRCGLPWTEAEEKELKAAHNAILEEFAVIHGRTVIAIKERIKRLLLNT